MNNNTASLSIGEITYHQEIDWSMIPLGTPPDQMIQSVQLNTREEKEQCQAPKPMVPHRD